MCLSTRTGQLPALCMGGYVAPYCNPSSAIYTRLLGQTREPHAAFRHGQSGSVSNPRGDGLRICSTCEYICR